MTTLGHKATIKVTCHLRVRLTRGRGKTLVSNAWQGQNAGVQGPKGDYWGEMNNGDYGYSGADMNQASGFGQNYGSNPNYGGNNYGGNPNYGDNSGFAP